VGDHPIDGTANFARGLRCGASRLAFVNRVRSADVIWQPVNGDCRRDDFGGATRRRAIRRRVTTTVRRASASASYRRQPTIRIGGQGLLNAGCEYAPGSMRRVYAWLAKARFEGRRPHRPASVLARSQIVRKGRERGPTTPFGAGFRAGRNLIPARRLVSRLF
jgi:hypothetical protein